MRRSALLLVLALIAPLSGCGDDEAVPDADVDVRAVIDSAAEAMAALESARFTMERSGAPVEVAGLEFASAEGQYAAPASARAILQVKAADLSVEVGTVAIGDQVWLTNPLTGAWEEIAAGSGFNIAIIFDPATGWVPLLTDDLSDITYLGRKDGNHLVAGTISAVRVEVLTAGLVEAQTVDAEIWIDEDSGHIVRVEFETTLDGAVSGWLIEMSEFDVPVTIPAPAGS